MGDACWSGLCPQQGPDIAEIMQGQECTCLSTSSASRKASCRGVDSPTTSRSRSLGITIRVSTFLLSASMPSEACSSSTTKPSHSTDNTHYNSQRAIMAASLSMCVYTAQTNIRSNMPRKSRKLCMTEGQSCSHASADGTKVHISVPLLEP